MPFSLGGSASGTFTGLDMGHSSVKCVELTYADKKTVFESAQILPLTSAGEEGLKETLRKLSRSLVSAAKHLRISVSGPSVLIRNLTLPKMTPQELKGAISFEAERHIPFPVSECVLDFQILHSSTPGSQSMNVILVAAKKQLIQDRLKILAAVGFEPELIDVDIFSFSNAFEQWTQEAQLKTYALLDIGHEMSTVAIFDEGELFLVREIPVGNASKNPDLLAKEIRKSVDYFENETSHELGRIFACGGGALSAEVLEKLSESLGISVTLWNNPKKMELGSLVQAQFLEEHFPELVVACGLALRPLA